MFVFFHFIYFHKSKLRSGLHDLRLWNDTEADGSEPSNTLGKLSCHETDVSMAEKDEVIMAALSKLTKRHRLGQMASLDWLDRLTFREIELINEREKRKSNFMFLMVEFPKIVWQGKEVNVVHNEQVSLTI